MKFNFKKIAATFAATAMLGSTIAFAGAATPSQVFTQGNTAIIYGASAASTDMVAATTIQNSLGLSASTSSPGLGSEFVQIKGPVQEFNLGRTASGVFTQGSIRKNHMPMLLADGEYRDNNNTDFKYTQEIVLGTGLTLNHFRDTDYSDTPAVGINLDSNAHVLTYKLKFNTKPDFTNGRMKNTDLPLFGKKYFVLNVDGVANSIELLDSSSTQVLNQGETKTANLGGKSYTVSIQVMDTNGVILSVNGQTTNKLSAGQTYKLADGSYIGVKELIQQQWAGGQQYVEFSIGAGKLILTNGSDVELNNDVISGLMATVNNDSGKLGSIELQWKTDTREFVTPTSEITMPGFGTLKMAMEEFYAPSKEEFRVERDGDSVRLANFPFADGTKSLNLVYGTSSITGLGRDANNKLVTSGTSALVYNRTTDHKMFVASYAESTWAESYLLSIPSTVLKDGENRATIRNEVTGQNICTELSATQTCSIGPIVLTVDAVNRFSGDNWNVELSISNGGSFNNLYSKEGLKVFLPVLNSTLFHEDTGLPGHINLAGNKTGHNAAAWDLYMYGQDKDGNIAHSSGGRVAFRIAPNSASTTRLHVSNVANHSAISTTSGLRIGDSGDRYEYYTLTDVPLKIVHDRAGDEYKAEVTYHGGQAYAKVFLSSTDSLGSSTTDAVILRDSEVSGNAMNRNWIVVGGSAVNSKAAQLMGLTFPAFGSAFTAASGVNSGEWIIRTFSHPSASGKFATVVAGYNAGETTNAASYFATQTPDISVGKQYIGSSATSATESVVSN